MLDDQGAYVKRLTGYGDVGRWGTGRMFGGDSDCYNNEGDNGMDIMEMFRDMPLVSVLMFQKESLEVHPKIWLQACCKKRIIGDW